jgi:hypothetical protein
VADSCPPATRLNVDRGIKRSRSGAPW